MHTIKVAGVTIRRDAEGRYCLNDLHKASGGHTNKRPSKWLRYGPAKALIEALDRRDSPQEDLFSEPFKGLRNVVTTAVGRPETYAVKQLVYAYAMWISPDFNLHVIEAYDKLVMGEFVQPSIQHENYWFERRPWWPAIRERVLLGETYRNIAAAIGRSAASVRNAVKRMIMVGLLSPLAVSTAQRGHAKNAALRYGVGWGIRQLPLFDSAGAQSGPASA